MFHVPVVNLNNEPLMPTTILRARKWMKSGKATGFWRKGVFCVRLNIKTEEIKQEIAVGVDPGSKKEAFTVKSTANTLLNIQADAVTWVKKAIEARKNARKARRQRNCPYRKPRFNRKKGCLAPSTKARWQFKLRVLNWLYSIYPVTCTIVEDIKAESKGKRRWDKSFSPLQIGKKWFYDQIPNLVTKSGYKTKQLRDAAGLHKTKNKLSKSFDAHCVDSWVLANSIVGGHITPENKKMIYLRPLQFHRRQLHMFQPAKGGKRNNYGSTMSMGLKRGSLVKHKKHGITYVGGTSGKRITLHNMAGERVTRDARVEDCKFLCYNSWTVDN